MTHAKGLVVWNAGYDKNGKWDPTLAKAAHQAMSFNETGNKKKSKPVKDSKQQQKKKIPEQSETSGSTSAKKVEQSSSRIANAIVIDKRLQSNTWFNNSCFVDAGLQLLEVGARALALKGESFSFNDACDPSEWLRLRNTFFTQGNNMSEKQFATNLTALNDERTRLRKKILQCQHRGEITDTMMGKMGFVDEAFNMYFSPLSYGNFTSPFLRMDNETDHRTHFDKTVWFDCVTDGFNKCRDGDPFNIISAFLNTSCESRIILPLPSITSSSSSNPRYAQRTRIRSKSNSNNVAASSSTFMLHPQGTENYRKNGHIFSIHQSSPVAPLLIAIYISSLANTPNCQLEGRLFERFVHA